MNKSLNVVKKENDILEYIIPYHPGHSHEYLTLSCKMYLSIDQLFVLNHTDPTICI